MFIVHTLTQIRQIVLHKEKSMMFFNVYFIGVGMGMNQVIEKILDHRSIRSFMDKPLTTEQIQTIVAVCSKCCNFKLYSSIFDYWGYRIQRKRLKFAEIAGNQKYVEKMVMYLYFVLTFIALRLIGEMEDKMYRNSSLKVRKNSWLPASISSCCTKCCVGSRIYGT